jgi:hypothetical protein
VTKAPLGLFVAMLGGFKAANQLQLASTLFVPLTSTFRHDEAPFTRSQSRAGLLLVLHLVSMLLFPAVLFVTLFAAMTCHGDSPSRLNDV